MKVDAKRMRILFLDDEHLPIVETLKKQGYDVDKLDSVGSLDRLCDGRYWVIFFDVRGVGAELDGNGLDVLKYVAEHNPLIVRFVYSAKPFEGNEAELLRRYANQVVPKDTSIMDVMQLLDATAQRMGRSQILEELATRFSLSWWQKTKLKLGLGLDSEDVKKMSKAIGATTEAAEIAANCVKLAIAIFAVS